MTLVCKASIISPWWSRPAFKGWLRVLNRKWLGWSGKDRNALRWSVQANPFWGVCAWRAHRGQPISRLAIFWLTHKGDLYLSRDGTIISIGWEPEMTFSTSVQLAW